MELICPNCGTKYRISTITLGGEGRQVRCVRCHGDWFQKPVFQQEEDDSFVEEAVAESSESWETESSQVDDIDYEKIQSIIEAEEEKTVSDRNAYADKAYNAPQTSEDKARKNLEEAVPSSVLPKQSSFSLPSFFHTSSVRTKTPASLQAKLTGYMGALTVLGAIALVFVMMQVSVIKTYPASMAIYDLMGMPVSFKGEGLVLESLSANLARNENEAEKLVVMGRILNIGENSLSIPALKAQLRSTNGDDGESWIIHTDLKELPKGESLSFKSDYEAPPQGVGSVNVSFMPEILTKNP